MAGPAPSRRMLLRRAASGALALLAGSARAALPAALKVGILSRADHGDAISHWQPVAAALSRMLGSQVELVALTEDALSLAVASRSVDFVVTNPQHYVQLRRIYGINALATARARVGTYSLDRVGCVIFTRNEDNNIHTLTDVRGHRVAAVAPYSLASYLLAADTFAEAGIDLRNPALVTMAFTGYPHELVVNAVRHGNAEVGIMRTGVLEEMVHNGSLRMDDLRVLNARPAGTYPQQLSTELVPLWPWSALRDTDPELAKAVTLALLNLGQNAPELASGRYTGFSPPASYANVERMMDRLHAYPNYGVGSMVGELWDRYQRPALGVGGLVMAGLGGLCVLLARSSRRHRNLNTLYLNAQTSLQTAAAAFDSQVGLLVADQTRKVLRVNAAFTQILGYHEADLVGRSTRLLRAPTTSDRLIDDAMKAVEQSGRWRGEMNCLHADGYPVSCLVTVTAVRGETTGMQGFVGSIVDVSQQRRDQAEIEQLAFFDPLTNLPNRRRFLEELERQLEQARASGLFGALMFLDLDHFKNLNDTRGHDVGDRLLQDIANRLQQEIGTQGMVARLGGDEFVIMLTSLSHDEPVALTAATRVAERVRTAVLQPYQLALQGPDHGNTLTYHCSSSIGIALFGRAALPLPDVMKRADIAMFIAKQAGRNTIRHFDPRVQQELDDRSALGAALTEALHNDELELNYQLQVDRFGTPLAAECLLRWNHPVRGQLLPRAFISVAEENGIIVAIGDWVIEQACRTLARWKNVPALARLELCVNVSPRQFCEADFAPKLAATLRRHDVRPSQLTLEITESTVLERDDLLTDSLRTLCELGVPLSIDDFGTGYSSLTRLQRLPLRQVKIDSSFIAEFESDRSAAEIVRLIIALSRSLRLTVVAEGVETEGQRTALVNMGCDLLQGYHLSPPMKLQDLEQHLLQYA